MKDTINCACGFLFSEDRTKVVLIQKQKPEWQKGKLNAVGGHIMEGETSISAIVREFEEETGKVTFKEDWELFCTIKNKSKETWYVNFYRSFGDVEGVDSLTDEKVYVINVHDVPACLTIPNLQWLVTLALDETVRMTTTENCRKIETTI